MITEQVQQVPKSTSDRRELYRELVAGASAVLDELGVDVRAAATCSLDGGGGNRNFPALSRRVVDDVGILE